MEDALCVDKKATVGEAFDCAMIQPLLGNVVQNPALTFPVHHVSRAIDPE